MFILFEEYSTPSVFSLAFLSVWISDPLAEKLDFQLKRRPSQPELALIIKDEEVEKNK